MLSTSPLKPKLKASPSLSVMPCKRNESVVPSTTATPVVPAISEAVTVVLSSGRKVRTFEGTMVSVGRAVVIVGEGAAMVSEFMLMLRVSVVSVKMRADDGRPSNTLAATLGMASRVSAGVLRMLAED